MKYKDRANNQYKYVPTTGKVLDTEGSIYGLDENIVGEDNVGNKITLDIPRDGEIVEINKGVKLDIKSTGIKTDNDTVKLTTGKRDGNKFIVNVEYPKNERGKDWLTQVFVVEEKTIRKNKMTFQQSNFDPNLNLVNTLEFDVNMFKNKIKFKMSPCIYELKGNLEFIIE